MIVGSPAPAILGRALHVEADTIILGPHRRGNPGPGEMGSTAASVVRDAPCPVLVAATDLRLPLERVMAPIDLSEVSSGALSVALTWASALRPRGADARLMVLHVAVTPMIEEAGQAVREEVQRARALAGGAARVEIGDRVVSASDPAQEILHRSASESTDLLVLGTRGPTSTASALGGVSAAVARAAACPLLLVPPSTWAQRTGD